MKNVISAAVLAIVLSSTVFATWAMIPLDELVADCDLIVIGTLRSAIEDSEGLGKGYIQVEHITTRGVRTLDGIPLHPGDNLKITWADNWACASGMHRGRENKNGTWLLKIQNDGTVTAAYPGRFRPVEDLNEIEKVLHRKQTRKNFARVDVSSENIRDEIFAESFASTDAAMPVDVTPFNDYSPVRALIAALFSLGLYSILYRSRFRIRSPWQT